MDERHFRLIFGLAEFMWKIDNSANLWLNVNDCGENTAEKTDSMK